MSWWSSHLFWQTSGQILPEAWVFWQPGHFSSSCCAFQALFPRSHAKLPTNIKPVLPLGLTVLWRPAVMAEEQMDWSEPFTASWGKGDGQHTQLWHSESAPALWGAYHLAGACSKSMGIARCQSQGTWQVTVLEFCADLVLFLMRQITSRATWRTGNLYLWAACACFSAKKISNRAVIWDRAVRFKSTRPLLPVDHIMHTGPWTDL